MTNATKLLRRALNSLNNLEDQLKDLGYGWLGGPQLREEIETFLAAEPETEEPVAWGQPDACGNIVETITPDDKTHTKAPKGWADIYSVPLYTKPSPSRKPIPEKIDPILRTVGSMSCSPSYVAGWNNCIDAMSNGAEARKPMTREEIIAGVTHDTSDDFHAGYWAGIRFAEKHHGIGGDDNG